MNKIVSVLAVVLLFIGCVQPFNIVSTEDKFSDSTKPYGFIGKNNRLSTKSSKGGIHIDDKGVYLNPYVFRDRQTNQVVRVGFYVNHMNFEINDGFRPIEDIIFLTDKNERIVLKVQQTDSDFDIYGWNSISMDFNTSYSERGLGSLPLQEFKKIVEANWIEVKIDGGKLSQTYEKDKIGKSFLLNLREFYTTKVQ